MQKTIAKAFTIKGIGLHSGKEFQAVISPAPCNTGIQFKRDDVRHCDYTRITPYNVSSTQLATTIDCGGLPISTIEHFSAAFYGQGIDNAFISVSGTEVPILDGSAKEVIENIEKAGILTQNEKRKVLKVTRPVSIEYEGKTVENASKRVDLYKERQQSLSEYQKQLEEYQQTLIANLDAEMAANQDVAETVGYKQDATVNEKLRNIEVNRELYQQIKSYSEIVNQISKVNQQIETTKGQVTDVTNKVRELTELSMGGSAPYERTMQDINVLNQLIQSRKNVRDPYADERSFEKMLYNLQTQKLAQEAELVRLNKEYNNALDTNNEVTIRKAKEEFDKMTNEYNKTIQEIDSLTLDNTANIRNGLADITTSLVVEGESWKDIWSNLWQDLAREAIQVLFGVQNVTKSFLGSLVGGGKGKGKGGSPTKHTGGNITSAPRKYHTGSNVMAYPKMHSGGMVEQGRKGVVPQLRNDEVVRTLQVGEEVNSLADRRSNEILGAVAMKALDSEQNRPNYVNIMAMDSKSFAEYLNENSDILMAIIGKQQAMGRGTRR